MSDRFSLVPIKQLVKWILNEYETKGEIFGISKELFFTPKKDDSFRLKRFGQLLETPLGVAAGPHTQMAQNIVAAWLVGARYIELKTVQTLDEIAVSKPCIDMEDEGYNCEWSQELRLVESFEEYLKAWIIIHLLRHKFGWENENSELGTIFNMSVGYSYDGILNKNVQKFLNNMQNAGELKKQYIDEIREFYHEIDKINIPDILSDNLTLSTMHGCPPEEIEKIANYLITERKLHTTIKLNPTLLGSEKLRYILNDKLGFSTIVPDIAFEHDLKYPDAVAMIGRLTTLADKDGVFFGLKLTNTLESVNIKSVFPENEKMMYMSGRALHAVSVHVAEKLQIEFGGKLDISFSAGADAFNIGKILSLNIRPVTVCSDLLKPGGYGRMAQYIKTISHTMREASAKSIEELTLKKAERESLEVAIVNNLKKYAIEVLEDKRYHSEEHPWEPIKTNRVLNSFDCIKAPCETTCPTHQNIPQYMYLTSIGEFEKALEVIRSTNPFPNSTGMACDHTCEFKCTRINYDNPLMIREIKRFVASVEKTVKTPEKNSSNGKKVSIIGAGPSGLSAAYYLAQKGFSVKVFEAKTPAGGMLTHALPDFRALNEKVETDIELIRSLGVEIVENHPVKTKEAFENIKNSSDYLYISTGAAKAKNMDIDGENSDGVWDFLTFLDQSKYGKIENVPTEILVIGGGNSAIDAARSAKRLVGDKGSVKLVYRRTRKEMPADREEIKDLIEENIPIVELKAPIRVVTESGKVVGLECITMKLSDPDESGRRRPIPVEGSNEIIPAGWIIKAIGQDTVLPFLEDSGVELTKWKTIKTDPYTHETTLKSVFAGGDVSRGPASIIKAVADGKEVAFQIAKENELSFKETPKTEKNISRVQLKVKKSERVHSMGLPIIESANRDKFEIIVRNLTEEEAIKEASRCLYCDEICDICVSVCPNRANVSYKSTPKKYVFNELSIANGVIQNGDVKTFETKQRYQVLNVGDFCNECGNCSTFCPTNGRPYEDKPKLYLTRESFNPEKNGYFHVVESGVHSIIAKFNGVESKLTSNGEFYIYENSVASVKLNRDNLSVVKVDVKSDGDISLENCAKMTFLLDAFESDLIYI